ncbi:hypothetical protein BTE48_15290 [Oceanospirillum multiglobuliferum]|uniref:Adenylate cyclase n=1 Tax=Oceanospirillum multiglobuliferum TaxID=64969 RepID=A0A1V4T142_9GAMM|nr:hypothetical protein BTE48_15290 [Oceanospirillum multiglobuliferum]
MTVDSFDKLLALNAYQPIPDDWYVLVADVINSTSAIANNRYQDVNTLGASVIIAVLNACNRLEIPYIFGGDGASLCVPPDCLEPALAALKGTAAISESAYNLKLRTGFVPVAVLSAQGIPLLVSKLRLSDTAVQASFTGGGLQIAEYWLKQETERYSIPDYIPAEADFSGLQCRWDRIPSPKSETVAILIEARCETLEQQSQMYQNVLLKIAEIYGTQQEHHPLQADKMRMTLSQDKLRAEQRLFSTGKSVFYKLYYFIKMRVIAMVGSFMMQHNVNISGFNWGQYKMDMIANSDHRKFDDMLRMVLAGTPEQREQLEAYFESEHKAGRLYYGVSVSEAALLTCLIFQTGTEHFHFVDGADGGYALAATQLKRQKYEQSLQKNSV